MSSFDSYDFSGVAAHRIDEVKRRIGVLEDYTARRITSAEAIERLQLSSPSFHRLLRAWADGTRPEKLGAAGRHRKTSRDLGEEVTALIRQVEENSRDASVRIVAERARAAGRKRSIRMPSHERVARYVTRLADRRDPGLLFASIVAAAPEYHGDARQWLEGGMREVGLPPIETVFRAAYRHLISPTAGEVGIFRSVYFQLLANGSGNNGRLADGFGLLDVKRLQQLGTVHGPMSVPTTVVRQNWNLRSAIPPLDDEGEAAMSRAASELQSFMGGFLEACR
jgi:hypothetical protein